ncbi:hypothetical protein EI427_22495 [Flammeovirga pectinis]|uniref:Uncharacterized protein n=1 Tax=Flammeovirga pectinis TaxID=2494373 RepID=A0A3S9P9Y7_9BACT|nr:hypothetical protein [Flammeovirga pectinis]AZQ64994.1 hypothetical protein EI427_22495 [Flammeovirga pectinis]
MEFQYNQLLVLMMLLCIALVVQEMIKKYSIYLNKKKNLLEHQTYYLNSTLSLLNMVGIVSTVIYLLKIEVFNFEIPIITLF